MTGMEQFGITLRDYVDERLSVLQKQLDQRYADNATDTLALADRVKETAAFHASAHEREHAAHAREHVLTESALGKADTSLDHRLDLMNEFRAQLRDQSHTLVSKDVLDSLVVANNARLEAVSRELDLLRAQNDRMQGVLSVARFLGVGGLATAAVALVLAFTGHPAI